MYPFTAFAWHLANQRWYHDRRTHRRPQQQSHRRDLASQCRPHLKAPALGAGEGSRRPRGGDAAWVCQRWRGDSLISRHAHWRGHEYQIGHSRAARARTGVCAVYAGCGGYCQLPVMALGREGVGAGRRAGPGAWCMVRGCEGATVRWCVDSLSARIDSPINHSINEL